MEARPLPTRPFRFSDIADLGIRKKHLRTLLADGAVVRLVRGVYLRADVDVTVTVRADAVSLAVNPHHVVCDRTAAWLHGIDVLTVGELTAHPPVEACSPPGSHPSERRGVDAGERDLLPSEVMTIAGVRVTTPTRTALDLGCVLRRREAFAALNDFARVHGITQEQVLPVVTRRYAGRRGVRQLRALLPHLEPRVESPRESWTLLELIDAGLPLPEPQFWIEIRGVPTYRLDFAYPWCRVAIEYDGEDWHDRTAEQIARDKERRAWLRDHGWTVIVLKRGHFTGRAVDRWTDQVRAALQPAYSNRRW